MEQKKLVSGLLSIVCLFMVGLGCISFNSIADAEEEVENFRQRIKNQSFDEIYNAAHSKFKEQTSRESAFKIFSSLESKYGTHINSKATNRNSKTTNGITIVNLTYESEYTKTKVTEEFEFLTENEALKMTYYNIKTR